MSVSPSLPPWLQWLGTCLGDIGIKQGAIKALKCTDWQLQLRPWPVNIGQLQSGQTLQGDCTAPLQRAPAPRTCLSFYLGATTAAEREQGHNLIPLIYQVHREERRALACKWDLQHVCWFYTSGSGRAAAGMTPDRKYRLRCFRVPKPPSASGVHKPPGSSNYDILTHNKQYLTPGEISLIFNLA